MASPWYTTDLRLLTDADGGAGDPGSWAELTGYTGGGGLTNPDTDYFIQGTGCTSLSPAGKTGLNVGINYLHNTTFQLWEDECFFIWHVLLAGNAMDTFANGGLRLGFGNSNGNAWIYYVGGRDFGRNPYGGWQNYAISPSASNETTIGTPTTPYQAVCCLPNLSNAISKGNLLAIDSIRLGRGDLFVTEGTISVPCTFIGMAKTNDLQVNRWGLFQEQAGGYLWKGRMTFGTAASAVYFDDSNRSIIVDVTPKTYRNFNRIDIRNASSTINWNGINITTLFFNNENISKGQLVVVDNATFYAVNCTFTDMDYFYFQSNTEMNTNVFRRCGTIYQQGSLLDGCTITNSTSAIAVSSDNLENIKNCNFISDGTGHAIKLTVSGDGGLVLDGCTFTNYTSANGSTGNEAIWNDTGGWITINVQNSTSIPSIRNTTPGSQTTVQLSVTLTLSGIVSGSEVRIQTARGVNPSGAELYHVETTDGNDVQWTYNYSSFGAGYYIDIIVHHVEYTHLRVDDVLLPAANSTIPIQQSVDRWYSNPIITKTETFGLRPTDTWQYWSDTTAAEASASTNFNTLTYLDTQLSIGGQIRHAFISPYFPVGIIPAFSTISSATLYLYLYENNLTVASQGTARWCTRNWVPTEATWNVWSTGNSWTSQGGDYEARTNNTNIGIGQTGWISWNVTADVQDWADGVFGSYPIFYGWVFYAGGLNENVRFYSANYNGNTSLRPYLSVTWSQ